MIKRVDKIQNPHLALAADDALQGEGKKAIIATNVIDIYTR